MSRGGAGTYVLAIDPGNVSSGWARFGDPGSRVSGFGVCRNREVPGPARDVSAVVIERIASYGMAVGRSVFETCFETGRFMESHGFTCNTPVYLVERRYVKMHLCHNNKAKDSNINQAVRDRIRELYGLPDDLTSTIKGTKKNPGPLYGISKDAWAALALAITFYETPHDEREQWRVDDAGGFGPPLF